MPHADDQYQFEDELSALEDQYAPKAPLPPVVPESPGSAPKDAPSEEDKLVEYFRRQQAADLDALKRAQKKSSENLLFARIGGAANTIGQGLAGQTPNNAPFDQMASDADRPIARLERSRKAKEANDQLLTRYFLGKDKVREQSRLQGEKIQASKEAAKTRSDFARAISGGKAEERKNEKLNRDTQELSERLNKAGLDELASVSEQIRSLFDLEGNADIPGAGMTAAAPDYLISKQGQDVRQAVAALKNIILRARSGGAVTPQEEKRFLEEIGIGATRSDAQLRAGIKNVLNRLQAKQQNILAGFGDEAKQKYLDRGGRLEKILPSPPTKEDAKWTEDKERRYQELKAKQQAGELR